jgi:hypothetical protein
MYALVLGHIREDIRTEKARCKAVRGGQQSMTFPEGHDAKTYLLITTGDVSISLVDLSNRPVEHEWLSRCDPASKIEGVDRADELVC